MWAAIRSLVLPYGATSGNRIVLDGVNANISAIGSNGTIKMTVTTGNSEIDFIDSSGATRARMEYDSASQAFLIGMPGPLGMISSQYFEQSGVAFESQVNGRAVRFDNTSGFLRSELPRGTAEVWNPITLQNGWVARPGFAVPSYRVSATGLLLLKGQLINGTVTNGTVIGQLPTTAPRPVDTDDYPMFSSIAVSGQNPRLEVNTSGQLIILGIGTGSIIGLGGIQVPLT